MKRHRTGRRLKSQIEYPASAGQFALVLLKNLGA
jgi:hypothetical protein